MNTYPLQPRYIGGEATGPRARPSTADLLLPVAPLALLTLWDFYWAGVRPFDFVALAALLLMLLVRSTDRLNFQTARPGAMAFAVIAPPLVVIALRNPEAMKSAVGLLAGLMLFALISAAHWPRRRVVFLLDVLLLVHCGLQLAQLAIYLLTDQTISPFDVLGTDSRLQWIVFRASGLFQEPAHFCLMVFSLLSLRSLIARPPTYLVYLALGSMFASVSLWGMITTLVYILLFRVRDLLWLAPPIGLLFTAGYAYVTLNAGPLVDAMFSRVTTLSNDGSAMARYGSLFDIDQRTLGDLTFWFGHGPSTEYVDVYGASGLAFALYAMGVGGLVLFIVLAGLRLARVGRLRGLPVILVMLTAASQWTFLWWWAWFALAFLVPEDKAGPSAA